MQSPLYLNPSFAGSNGLLRAQFIQQKRDYQLAAPRNTYAFTADAYIKPIKAGLGISYAHKERIFGVYVSDHLSLSYAQYFTFLDGDLKIIPSLQSTFTYQSADWSKISFHSLYLENYEDVEAPWPPYEALPNAKVYYEFSPGILLHYKKITFGTTLYHINRPDVGMLSTYRLPCRLNSHVNYTLKWNEKTQFGFLLNHNYQDIFGHRVQGMLNTLFFKRLMLGSGYDSFNYFVGSVGYRGNCLSVNITYGNDFWIIESYPKEMFEFSFSYSIRQPEKRNTMVNFENW